MEERNNIVRHSTARIEAQGWGLRSIQEELKPMVGHNVFLAVMINGHSYTLCIQEIIDVLELQRACLRHRGNLPGDRVYASGHNASSRRRNFAMVEEAFNWLTTETPKRDLIEQWDSMLKLVKEQVRQTTQVQAAIETKEVIKRLLFSSSFGPNSKPIEKVDPPTKGNSEEW